MLKISFIGAGSIAESLLAGLLEKNVVTAKDIALTNRSNVEQLQYLADRYQLQSLKQQEAQLLEADVIILAVKPQVIQEVLTQWGPRFHQGQQIISVAAGVTTDVIASFLAPKMSVIRAMPNTSSTIGMSATAITAGKYCTAEEIQRAEAIFRAIGTVVVLPEHLMDAATGLAGSGPAYFYLMVEGLELAAQKVGLSREISRQLILQTLVGASHMLLETKKEPEVLRAEITSEGGTTAAGLAVMKDYRFIEGLEKTIEAATNRSKEMGKNIREKQLR